MDQETNRNTYIMIGYLVFMVLLGLIGFLVSGLFSDNLDTRINAGLISSIPGSFVGMFVGNSFSSVK